MNENELTASCSKERFEIHRSDLPLSCPMPNTTNWNAHPRVYLDVESHGQILCPYCGTLYVLVE